MGNRQTSDDIYGRDVTQATPTFEVRSALRAATIDRDGATTGSSVSLGKLTPLETATKEAQRLAALLGLEFEAALDLVNCTEETRREVTQDEELLQACTDFLAWVNELVDAVDLAVDRRSTAQHAAKLFLEAGRDVEKARGVCDAGPWPAVDILRLGEVDQAFQLAARHLGTPAGLRGRYADTMTQLGDHAVHLTDTRVADLFEGRTELLGTRVAKRMRQHLDLCPACGDAYLEATQSSDVA